MSHQDRVFFGNFLSVLGALVVLAFVFYFIASSLVDDEGITPAMQERAEGNIEPVGEVYVAGESEPPAPAPSAGSATMASSEPASPETIFNRSCMACHMTGAAGAPKLGDTAAWAPRIAKGVDTLVQNAIKGLNAMPPKGTCMTCSDDEIEATVEYIVGKSQ